MNYNEAHEFIGEKTLVYVKCKFEEIYPDLLTKCTTDSKDVYEKANGCPYSWYMHVIWAISEMNFSPEYSRTENEVVESDWSCVNRFDTDLRLAGDEFLYFIIKNVLIR